MCGRYASFLPAEAVARLFHAVNPLPNFPPTWNMAPTQDAMVVRHHPQTSERHLDLLKWGLLPYFTKDPVHAKRPINARAETVATSGVQVSIRQASMPCSCRYVLRVEGGRGRQAAVRHRALGWSANGVRWAVGRVQVAGWHCATDVHDHDHQRQRDGR